MIRKNSKPVSESKSYVEVSQSAVYFFGALLLAMTFASGYFWGKVNATATTSQTAGTTVQTNTVPTQPPQQQAQAQQPAKPQISLDLIKGVFAKDVIKFGKGDKKLLMIEVADPSCPYCQVAGGANTEIGKLMGPQFTLAADGGTYIPPVPEMRKLVDSGKADFAWIYTPGHGNGALATKALYCAFDQGKFWQAHDLLMSAKGYDLLNNQIKTDTTQTKLVVDFLAKAVDVNSLKSCLDSGKYDARLGEDTSLATSLGVQGTPGFYLNTTNFAGAYSWKDMKSTADAAL
jgi:protein-disulfide isomerase